MVRIRQRPTKYYSGWFSWEHPLWYSRAKKGSRSVSANGDYSADTVHPYPFVAEDDLTLIKLDLKPARFSWSTVATVPYKKTIKNGPATITGSGPSWSVDWGTLEAHSVNASQDMSPLVDIPLNVIELKDFPRMIRAMKRLGKRFLASPEGFLSYQFAVKPLVNDMLKLLSLQKSIAKRVARHRKKFRTLRSKGKGPNIVLLLSHGAYQSTQNVGYSDFVTVDYTTLIKRQESWYVAKLVPQLSLSEVLEQASSVQHNLGFGDTAFTTLYNAFPWSFLVDYFSNLGDVIAANNNLMPYKVSSVNLMVHFQVETKIHTRDPVIPENYEYYVATDGSLNRTYKERRVVLNPSGKWVVSPLISRAHAVNMAALIAANLR